LTAKLFLRSVRSQAASLLASTSSHIGIVIEGRVPLQLHSFLPESNLGWWLQSEDVTLPSDTRRLAAIVSADIVGFSRVMGQDETGTLATLNAITSEHVRPLIQSFGGRMVKEMGDGVNIASRLQEIAVPGGVAVSQSVYEHLDEDSAVGFQDQGE